MRARPTILGLALCLAASACGRAEAPAPEAARATEPPPSRELVVFAASSLGEAFGAIAADFEASHPGVDVTVQLAGSQALRAQIEHGAPADVFASADAPHVEALARGGLVGSTTPFAANTLVIAVPKDAEGRVASAADLPSAERIVLGARDVPVGAYTERFLARGDALFGAGFGDRVRARVVSREANVRLVLAKVALGEADAAVVYATDARAAEDAVRAVPIPREANVRAEYVAATLRAAREPALAGEWVAFLLSPTGRRHLEARGFEVDLGERATR